MYSKNTTAMKILIAEDDKVSRRILEKNIKKWGYDVISANNGQEAWNILQKDEIRLVLLDWLMPGIDGIELCRRIRQIGKGKSSKYTYIILLTSKDGQEDIIKGLESGADDYLTKPANYLELKIRVQNGRRIIELEDSRLKMASFDSLTNLWNRGKIFEFFEEELERSSRDNRSLGAIIIDVDNFKKINDTHGHCAGDTVLCEVASRLRNSIRRYDKIGRFGGDEMLVILPNCSKENVQNIAERLRQVVCSDKIKITSGLLRVSISLGGASSGDLPLSSWKNLIQISDSALYLAKKKGRNLTVIHKDSKKKHKENN